MSTTGENALDDFDLDAILAGRAGAGGEGAGAGGEGAGAGGEGGGADDDKTKAAALIADQQRTLLEKDRQIEELRKTRGTPLGTDRPEDRTQVLDPADARGKLVKNLEEKFARDGLGATLADILITATQAATVNAERSSAPMAAAQVDFAIDTFRKDKSDDPLFAAVHEDFDTLVKQARENTPDVSKLTAQQVRESLESIWERAAGRVALKQTASRREHQPPPYGQSGGGGSGNFRVLQGGATDDMTPRDAVEREIVESAKSYNLSDDMIKASLKAHREDAG